jgi:hypothetical protein
MTAGQGTRRLTNISLAPAPLAALLAATLVGGAMIGAGITQQLGSTGSSAALTGAAVQPAATFDAVKFRAEEREVLAPQEFDAVKFRAEERELVVAEP